MAADDPLVPHDAAPLCRNCRHAVPEPWWSALGIGRWKYAKCSKATVPGEATQFALVTGAPDNSELLYCAVARKHETFCGQGGKLWEPRR